jgi:hypothetical protein
LPASEGSWRTFDGRVEGVHVDVKNAVPVSSAPGGDDPSRPVTPSVPILGDAADIAADTETWRTRGLRRALEHELARAASA